MRRSPSHTGWSAAPRADATEGTLENISLTRGTTLKEDSYTGIVELKNTGLHDHVKGIMDKLAETNSYVFGPPFGIHFETD